jgi:hypothetical protein
VLLPTIVGACYEIVEPTNDDGSANSDALLSVQARIVGDSVGPDIPVSTSARRVSLYMNNGALQEYDLPDPTPLTTLPLDLLAGYIQTNMTGVKAYTLDDDRRLVLESLIDGASSAIKIASGGVNSAHTILGIDRYEDLLFTGAASYENQRIWTPFSALPVIRGDITQMDILEDEIRVFLLVGGVLEEIKRDESVLRHRYNESPTMVRTDPDYEPVLLDTFPQALFAHQLKALDDGDADGTTPWFYGRGTNAFLEMGDSLNDQYIIEAKGDQDVADMGAYHGSQGNNVKVKTIPSGGTGPTPGSPTDPVELVSVAGQVLTQYPTVTFDLTVNTGTDPIVSDTIASDGLGPTGARQWTGIIASITGTSPNFQVTVHSLAPIGAGDYAAAPYSGYVALVDSFARGDTDVDNDGVGIAYTGTIANIAISTTASEQVTAINADTAASNLVKATLRGNGSDPVVIPQVGKYGLTLGGGETSDDFRLGDMVAEVTGVPVWEANVTNLVDADDILVAITSGLAPRTVHSFNPADDTNVTFTISAVTDYVLEGDYMTGGRDPVDFSYSPTTLASDQTKVRSDLPAAVVAWGTQNTVAAVIRVASPTGTFQRNNYIQMTRGGNTWMYPILDASEDFLVVGMNPGKSGGVHPGTGASGDVYWPWANETVTEMTGRAGNYAATGTTATVSEFHTVCYVTGTASAPAVGDTATITGAAAGAPTWTATIEKVVEDPANPGQYWVVLSTLNQTAPGTNFEHGLPAVAATETFNSPSSGAGSVAAHSLKTVPSAGGTLYFRVAGSSELQVDLDGTENPTRVAEKIDTIAVDTGANFAEVGADGFLLLNTENLDTGSPLNWRDNLGQETTMELSGDLVPYIFGSDYSLPSPYSPTDYPAVVFNRQFINFKHFGQSFPVKAGDMLYDGTTAIGVVVRTEALNIGGQVFDGAKVVIDRDSVVSGTVYDNWYLRAVALTEGVAPDAYTPPDRPYPELSVFDLTQDFLIRHNDATNYDGTPVVGALYNIYMDWQGLRLDVTSSADDPDLQLISDTVELEERLGPTVPANPLTFGMFLALINAPEVTIAGLGLDEVTADAEYGTLDSNARAAEFLENKEDVYAIATMHQDPTANRMWQLHADVMSEPENKSERIVLINQVQPTERVPDLVGSGEGESISGQTNKVQFDPSTINLSAALGAIGVTPAWTPTDFRDAGIYLDISSDNKNYLVSSVVGQIVTVQVAHAPGQNDDGFYANADMPTLTAGGEIVAIYQRGAPIINNGEITETLGALASEYADRRVVFTQPDRAVVNVDGVEQEVPGFYWGAAIAGMIAGYNPSQPFTNIPMVGFTRPKNSSDKFTKQQMNVGAGGGVYWIIQSTPGGAVYCRHQLTTDLTSIETRELSIVKAVDFVAKFLRVNVSPLIGRFNITQGYLDTLTILVEAALEYLRAGGVVAGAYMANLVVDETNPDTILLDVVLDPLYPANYIRITLII